MVFEGVAEIPRLWHKGREEIERLLVDLHQRVKEGVHNVSANLRVAWRSLVSLDCVHTGVLSTALGALCVLN